HGWLPEGLSEFLKCERLTVGQLDRVSMFCFLSDSCAPSVCQTYHRSQEMGVRSHRDSLRGARSFSNWSTGRRVTNPTTFSGCPLWAAAAVPAVSKKVHVPWSLPFSDPALHVFA